MQSPLVKTLLLSDSHAKSAAFINWIASHQKVGAKRINFSAVGASDDHVLDYLDIGPAGAAHRVLGGRLTMLEEPLFGSIARGAQTAVFLLADRRKGNARSLIADASQPGRVLAHGPRVLCVCGGDDTRSRHSSIQALFPGASDVKIMAADIGDYLEIWQEVLRAVREEPAIAAKQVSAPAQAGNHAKQTKGAIEMATAGETLNALMQIDGALGGVIGDYNSGMLLAKAGGGVNLDMAAAGNSEVIKAKMKTMAALGLKESIEDILITLGSQYHILRPIPAKAGLFMYLVLDKGKANLAMARFKVGDVEKSMTM